MKILEVDINNYRQYRGNNIVKLSTNLEKNITIIQGDNGCGKSNFMNAITWCLYDDEMFKSKTNEGRNIINESALFDAEGEDVEVSVTVTIGEQEPNYKFKRFVKFALNNGKPYIADKGFICREIDPDKGWIHRDNPEWIIERNFIKSSLKSFFFFDGEKMDKYFENTSEIKKNVEQIAQIDLIDDVLQTLNEVKAYITKKKKKISPITKQLDYDPQEIQEQIEQAQNEKAKLEETRRTVILDIGKIDDYLKENSNEVVKGLQKMRSDKENQRISLNKSLNGLNKNQRVLIASSVPLVYGYKALKESHDKIEEGTEKGELPPNIKDVFIRDLLEKGVCICGRDLKDDSESRKHVKELLDRVVPNSMAEDSATGKFVISALMEKTNFREEWTRLRKEIKDLTDEIYKLTNDLESISQQLSSFNEFEISEKEEQRRILNEQRDQLSVEIGSKGNQIDSLESKKKDLDLYFYNLDKSNEQVARLNSISKYVNSLIADVTIIRNSIVDEVRVKLEEKTKEYFFKMIWKKNAFSDVRIINEDNRYRISVLSDKGQECLGDISAGERQVLALSFTASLYLISGFSAPVFIDTPLGRISEQPRINVAENLPNYLSETQVVILPTDTEYTPEVRSRLLPSVGQEYRIQYDTIRKESRVIDYERC